MKSSLRLKIPKSIEQYFGYSDKEESAFINEINVVQIIIIV